MLRKMSFVVLYLLAGVGANPVFADGFEDLLIGDMRAMVLHEQPVAVSKHAFLTSDETEATLADYQGRYVLLNFWATWCAPCRHEMQSLDVLNQNLGGDDFIVVTLATGRNPTQAIRRFFEETGVESLTQYRDINQQIAREMGVFGLPITVILNPEGQEIARLRGDADWASDEAVALIEALIASGDG